MDGGAFFDGEEPDERLGDGFASLFTAVYSLDVELFARGVDVGLHRAGDPARQAAAFGTAFGRVATITAAATLPTVWLIRAEHATPPPSSSQEDRR